MSSVAVVSEAFHFLLEAVETADDSLPEEGKWNIRSFA